MTDTAPLITVLIPVRNEEADIEACLRAVLMQDHPHDRMEIVLVDGGSTDSTAAVAQAVLAGCDATWRLIRNPLASTPSNLNAGLSVASGQILCRVDARSIIPPNYVRLCAEVLAERSAVAVTGGAQIALANGSTPRAIGIARALNNRYVMGGARYRSGAASGATDTVYLGAFRTSELRTAGGWDEAMLTNQDYELNRRLGHSGIVWFDDRLAVGYVPRRAYWELWRQYHRFGRWKVRYWRRSGERPQPRQIRRLLAMASIIGVVSVVLLRPGQRRVRNVSSAAALGTTTLLLIDHVGTAMPEPHRCVDRVAAVIAMCTVGGGWCAGVLQELVSGVDIGSGPDRGRSEAP